jgi:hypothetical protein
MSTPNLGHLERVELRTIWENEASHFRPWIAQKENLADLLPTVVPLATRFWEPWTTGEAENF